MEEHHPGEENDRAALAEQQDAAETSGEAGPFRSGAGGTSNAAAVTADAMPADEARLREQFQQLWDVPHTRELLVEGLRDFFKP